MPRRRSLALIAAACVLSHLLGSGAQTLALLTDSEATSATVTTATCFVADDVAPTVSATVVSKATPYLPGYVRQGGTFHVYANVADAGCQPSGVSTVKADVSAIAAAQTSLALAAGAFTVGGQSYGYRSATMTADATLAEGARTYALTSTDVAGNPRTQSGFGVTVDNTRPAASDVQTANGGATAGKPEAADSVTFTTSEVIDPETVLAGWTGAQRDVVVRITDGGLGNDVLSVRNAANTASLPFGSVTLGGLSYVSATRDFGATGTPSRMTQSGATITIVLGTASGATGTQIVAGAMQWTPTTTLTDRAGNTCTTGTAIEGGAVDLEF